MEYKGTEMSGGALAWFIQRLSGFALIIFLMIHFVRMHFFIGDLTYENVARSLVNPLWKTFDLAFLVLALYHGLNGIWAVVLDYVNSRPWQVAIYSALVFLGLFLLVLGTITILPFSPQL